MPLKKEEIIDLVKQFNKCKTDKDKYKFIIAHNKDFKVVLDNDYTWAELIKDKRDRNGNSIYGELDGFNEYVGWDDGVFTLFELLGIKSEGC